MAIGLYFSPESMSGEQFDEVHRRLKEMGQAEPAGRTYRRGIQIGPNVPLRTARDRCPGKRTMA